MIFSFAHNWHKTLKIDFDDAVSEGNLTFTHCITKYDGRAKFGTLLFVALKNHFTLLYAKEKNKIHFSLLPEENLEKKHSIFLEKIELLSPLATTIVRWVIDNLGCSGKQGNPRRKKEIINHFKQMGYDMKAIKIAIQEIRAWL